MCLTRRRGRVGLASSWQRRPYQVGYGNNIDNHQRDGRCRGSLCFCEVLILRNKAVLFLNSSLFSRVSIFIRPCLTFAATATDPRPEVSSGLGMAYPKRWKHPSICRGRQRRCNPKLVNHYSLLVKWSFTLPCLTRVTFAWDLAANSHTDPEGTVLALGISTRQDMASRPVVPGLHR